MSFDFGDVVFLYVLGATIAIVLWAVVVYVIEERRRGSTPWTEWYNDRVAPRVRGREKRV